MRLRSYFHGDSLKARAARGTVLTIINFGGQNALRLVSNLILTRILFPEAFGLMALVQVFLTGIAMFSDIGTGPAIVQSERGRDPVFLNTAWTLQILRGLFLWGATLLLAAPFARFYGEPALASLLPVAGLSAVIQGFNSTWIHTAHKDLIFGRLTVMALGSQLGSILFMIALAVWLQSVWALVFGSLLGVLTSCVLSHLILPGPRNRFQFEVTAARNLFRFGRYVFLATIAGFVVNQMDRAILGKVVDLNDLALYNIGLMVASVPLMIGRALNHQIVFPLYAHRSLAEDSEYRAKINRARWLLTSGLVLSLSILALIGDPMIHLLYDTRYEGAGPILVLIAIATFPVLILMSYHDMPLAAGHSGRFAVLVTSLAVLSLGAAVVGARLFGLGGVAAAPGIAALLFYPVLLHLIRSYKGWDPVHDAVFLTLAVGVTILVVWLNGDRLLPLFVPH